MDLVIFLPKVIVRCYDFISILRKYISFNIVEQKMGKTNKSQILQAHMFLDSHNSRAAGKWRSSQSHITSCM